MIVFGSKIQGVQGQTIEVTRYELSWDTLNSMRTNLTKKRDGPINNSEWRQREAMAQSIQWVQTQHHFLNMWLCFDNENQIAISVPECFFGQWFEYCQGENKSPWFDIWKTYLMMERVCEALDFDKKHNAIWQKHSKTKGDCVIVVLLCKGRKTREGFCRCLCEWCFSLKNGSMSILLIDL